MHIPPIIFSLLNQCPGLHFKYGLVFDSLFKQKKIVVNIKKICPKNPKEKIGKVYFNIIIGNECLFFPFFTKYNITTINIEVKKIDKMKTITINIYKEKFFLNNIVK